MSAVHVALDFRTLDPLVEDAERFQVWRVCEPDASAAGCRDDVYCSCWRTDAGALRDCEFACESMLKASKFAAILEAARVEGLRIAALAAASRPVVAAVPDAAVVPAVEAAAPREPEFDLFGPV